MGSALSHALADGLRVTAQRSDWPAEFCKAFADAAGISESSYVASPDALAGTLGNAVQALNATLEPPGKGSATSWAATVSERFQKTAIRVFDRRTQLTPGTAASIRLAALCLAAEADALKECQVGEAFRHIAAGVTLLERRR